jgi:uncharacterized protein YoxC
MWLTSVDFLGVPSVQRPDEDMTIELQYSPDFKPGADDVLLLMPVGWKNLDEHKSITRTNGQTRLTISIANLPNNDSYQFVYVQEKVPFGVSSPFLVDIPYDEEPLQDESLDPDIVLVKLSTATAVKDIKVNTVHQNSLGGKKVATDCSIEPSINSTTEKQLQESMNDGHTDEESFCLADMSLFSSYAIAGDSLLAQLTQAMKEKDKVSKLFQEERRITAEQENRYEHLQQQHQVLMEENSRLKEALEQKQNEIDQLRKADRSQSSQLSSVRQQAPVKVTSSTHDKERANGPRHQVCTHQSISSCSLSSSVSGTKQSCSEPQNDTYPCKRRRNRQKRWTKYPESHRKSCDHHGDPFMDAFDCPVCSGRFPKADGTTSFQRHVHSHFKEEKIFY